MFFADSGVIETLFSYVVFSFIEPTIIINFDFIVELLLILLVLR